MITPEQILGLFEVRRNNPDEIWRKEAIQVKRLMNGQVFAPVTGRFGEEEAAVVANLAVQNLDQLTRRIVSTKPNVRFTSLQPGRPASDRAARTRRLASLGFWDQNKVELQDRKRVRWLQGYGVGPIQIGPHPTESIPKWNLRDPLATYPAPCDYQDDYTPRDCIYAYKRTYAWVKEYYPQAAFDIFTHITKGNQKCNLDTMFEIVEYIDAEERVLVLSHKNATSPSTTYGVINTGNAAIELDRSENRLGICPVVAPSLISIDRIKSPYYGNVGMEYMRNKLAALEYLFAEKTVFPESYFVEPPNSPNGEIVELADAESGKIGHLRGGTLENINMQPNFAGAQMSSRLEQEERTQNSTPAEWGGESASNIRTGIRGQNIASAAVDYTIQESQEILSLAKAQELKIAIKVDKTYFNRPKSFYVGKGTASQKVDYDPAKTWETDQCEVYYSAVGGDANQFVIGGGQRIAQQTLSRETFMENDPLVADPETEKDRVQAEMLRQAGFTQLMQPGALDPVTMAKIAGYVASNEMEWWEAVEKVQKEAQERQATQDAEGNPTGVDPASPEAQPGIAPGQESGIAATQGQEDLAGVLASLRRPQMTVNGA